MKLESRYLQIVHWLEQCFPNTNIQLEPLTGDASFRRYYRVKVYEKKYILSDCPPDSGSIKLFCDMSEQYQACELKTPTVYQADLELGVMLLEDFGNDHLIDIPTAKQTAYGEQAIDLLVKVRMLSESSTLQLPIYDHDFVQRELDIFTEWCVAVHCGITLSESEQQLFDTSYQILIDSALAQPQAGMHRDYHSRNLMVLECGQLGVIDHQDSVCGPITYDCVSLLRDCYRRLSDNEIELLAKRHYLQLKRELQMKSESQDDSEKFTYETYIQWLDLMGVQRHLKAAGIFCRLSHRDNKHGYLDALPLTLTYIVEIGMKYPQLQPLANWVQQKVVNSLCKSQQR